MRNTRFLCVATMILTFFFHFTGVIYSCDPILLSIITSKELTDQREQEIQTFSASLNLLGSKWRSKEELLQRDLNAVKLQWLKIFESFFTKPAVGIDTPIWESSFLEISSSIKQLQLELNEGNQEAIHSSIIHIQNLLISLYESNLDLPFFDSINLLKELIIQHRKTRDKNLEEDLVRIHLKLSNLWEKVYPKLPSDLAKIYSLPDWNQKLDEILAFNSGDFENLGLTFLQNIKQTKWNTMEPQN